MASQTVIITGGNSGLGFECAKTIALANEGWHIVIACRNAEKGLRAARAIADETGSNDVSTLSLDLSSLKSVRHFAQEFAGNKLPALRGLICNAGLIVNNGTEYTSDGFEMTFGVNHLGHFLLTRLLLDQLVEPARIVVVSSNTHNPAYREGRINPAAYTSAEALAHPAASQKAVGMQRYTTSKLCNLLFSYELNRELRNQGKQITVNSFDPGFTPGTNFAGGSSKPLGMRIMGSWFGKAVFKLIGVKTSTPKASGQAMARLLLDPGLSKVSGKYFQILEEITSSEESYDQGKAKALWEASLKMTRDGTPSMELTN